jgi:hypothetical protein
MVETSQNRALSSRVLKRYSPFSSLLRKPLLLFLQCLLLFSASASDVIGIESSNKLSDAAVGLDESVSLKTQLQFPVYALVVLTHKSLVQFAVAEKGNSVDKVSVFVGYRFCLLHPTKCTYH